ncbi:MAG TPA: ROK family protein [Terriglobia bacterium]|nr:ROK family protein [Terriglobia bacterium]
MSSHHHSVLAVDVGGTKLAVAVVDEKGEIHARQSEPVDQSSSSAPIAQICRMAKALSRSDPHSRPRSARDASWKAVGVAVPGLVRREGTVWAPNLRGWNRVPLATRLAQRLGVRVVVESDRNAAVSGEAWRGAGRGKSDVIALIVGTGIGAGIVSGGCLLRGAHELSGCAGWMVVSEEENSEFAKLGCLESVTAGPGIVRAVERALLRNSPTMLSEVPRDALSAQDVAEAARQGDVLAKKLFERAGKFLGFAVANLISLFDPEVVVLGGGLAGAADLYFEVLKQTALDRCQPLAAERVKIRVSRLGNDANLLGAARLALDAPPKRRTR